MVKLYLAICKSPTDGSYFISNHFYSSQEEAKAHLGVCYAGLFMSGPSIAVPEPQQNKAPEQKPKEAIKSQSVPVEVQEEFSDFNGSRI